MDQVDIMAMLHVETEVQRSNVTSQSEMQYTEEQRQEAASSLGGWVALVPTRSFPFSCPGSQAQISSHPMALH